MCFNDSTSDQENYQLQDSFFRYLASGCNFHELHFSYRIGISTASKIEKYVLVFGLLCFLNVFPNLQKSSGNWLLWIFFKKGSFPHCVVLVDGKYIRVIKPEHSGWIFSCYKDFFVVLMAVADTNYRFLYVDIGSVLKRLWFYHL